MSRSGTDATWCALATLAIVLGLPAVAGAGQLGALASPGALSKAHASLEGAANCVRCHEPGRKVTAERCLTCHKPIAERMARKAGVHRNVTTDCVSCHAEHVGAAADLRHIDTRSFNHQVETGFALEGRHAKTAAACASCHKTRSFLNTPTACSSCHTDVHKGTLGAGCTACHSPTAAFKAAASQFNHSTTRFTLTGAHQAVSCTKCHKTPDVFRGLAFDTCASCHTPPHRRTLGPSCTTCHTTERWATRTIDHSRTAFPLTGLHAQVACAKCHQAAITKPLKFDRCAACHVNVHKDSIKDDCRACHTEKGFRGAPFDHPVRTGFALEGRHQPLACAKCHTTSADFSGASRDCVSCHADQHKGAYGRQCDSCHRPSTFDVAHFSHPRVPEFFGGQHAGVACVKCHTPGAVTRRAAASPSTACATCHADVHLGQVGVACERCHTVGGAHFSAQKFSHETASFPLTGRHAALECVKCHPTRTLAFPAKTGAAMHLRTGTECRTCHADPHLGQADAKCETCHATSTFAVTWYTHRGLEDFFGGFHGRYACRACHKKETGVFPAGPGTAVRFKVGRTCEACHPKF